MQYLRLSDEDREWTGCDEWLPFDDDALSVEEAEALEEAGGDWTDWRQRGIRPLVWRLWMTLRRSGVTVDFDELCKRVNLAALRSRDDDPGKAPADSASSVSPTSPTSATSTPRSTRTRSKRSA
jgi:hypothetical protein